MTSATRRFASFDHGHDDEHGDQDQALTDTQQQRICQHVSQHVDVPGQPHHQVTPLATLVESQRESL